MLSSNKSFFLLSASIFLLLSILSTKSFAYHPSNTYLTYVPSNAHTKAWTCYTHYGCKKKHGSKITWYEYMYSLFKYGNYKNSYGGTSKEIKIIGPCTYRYRPSKMFVAGTPANVAKTASYGICRGAISSVPGMGGGSCPNLGFTYSGKHAFCCNPSHAVQSSGSSRTHK